MLRQSDSPSAAVVPAPAWRLLFGLAVLLGLSQDASAQFGADLWDEFNSNSDRTVDFDQSEDPRFQPVSMGANWRARVGHLAFETFGRNDSITHVELMPIIPLDNAAVFSDWRLFVDNNGEVGANLGLGYRQWIEELDQVVGASFWYDGDNTTTEYFNQLGVGFEVLGDNWDLLSNIYFPVGDDEKEFSAANANARFSGNSLLFDRISHTGEAMPGGDLEFGVLIPTEFGYDHEVRAYVGWYYFDGDEREDIHGYRIRAQGDLTSNITARIEYTEDDTFGSNLIFGASIVLPGGLSADTAPARRRERHLARFPQRNYNIIVSRGIDRQTGLTATNPSTGNAYDIRQIRNGAGPGGDGSTATPFDSFSAASTGMTSSGTASGETVFVVRSGSTLDEDIVLSDSQQLLGEGTGQSLIAAGFGAVALPNPSGGTTAPILTSGGGNAVTLASNSRVAGFTIDGAGGHGVFGSGISNATLSDLTIQNSGMDNLFLEDVAGPLTLTGLTLGDATGASFHLDGTMSDVSLSGDISNSVGRSVLIENTSADTTVDLREATIQDSGSGLLIAGVDGNVQLSDVTVTGGSGTGVEVTDNSGAVIFNGLNSVSGTAGPGIHVHDTVDLPDVPDDPNTPQNESTEGIVEGQVFFNEIDVTADSGTGLLASDATRLLVRNGTIRASNGAAVANITDSTIDIRLRSLFADGGPFAVNLAESTGTFAALGNGSGAAGSGGLIQNTTTAFTVQNSGTVFLQFVDFDSNQHVLSDIGSDRVRLASSNVTNTSGGALAPDVMIQTRNTRALEIFNSTFDGTNGIGLLDGTYDTVDSFSASFSSNTITSNAGDVFRLTGEAGSEGATFALTATGNQIMLNQANTDALDITWDGPIQNTVSNNRITGFASANTGFRFNGTSTSALAQAAVQNNFFTFNGGGSTGVDLVTAGPAQFTVASNTFDFNGLNGTGMNFDVRDTSSIGISSNMLTDDASGATAALFTFIADGSSVAVENNMFDFNSASAAIDRGIVFQAVETDGTISLSGNIDNVITGAARPTEFIPNTTVGTFPVNGVRVP